MIRASSLTSTIVPPNLHHVRGGKEEAGFAAGVLTPGARWGDEECWKRIACVNQCIATVGAFTCLG